MQHRLGGRHMERQWCPAGIALPAVRPGTADPGLVCNTTTGTPAAQQPAMPGSAGKSDGSNLFDALLLAASGGVALSGVILTRSVLYMSPGPLLARGSLQWAWHVL